MFSSYQKPDRIVIIASIVGFVVFGIIMKLYG